MKDRVFSRSSFRQSGISTEAYAFNTEPGVFRATLVMKAEAHPGILRLFFLFDDGRRIIAPAYDWQGYLGFYEIPNGAQLVLTFEENARGVFLVKASEIP